MKKNILIIGLTGILGTFVALSSCGPDYETEFNVLTLTIPRRLLFFRFPAANMR